VRARLVTDWTAYLANNGGLGYPNHMPDPSSYIELGCYLIDTSEGDPPRHDDDSQPDPGFGGTFETAWPNCTIDLFYASMAACRATTPTSLTST
jgi:hypothetical protein